MSSVRPLAELIEGEKYQFVSLVVEVFPIETNCYIIIDKATKQAAVIDPGSSAPAIKAEVDKLGATVAMIINTHAHWDHVTGNVELAELTGAPIMLHQREMQSLADSYRRCRMPADTIEGAGKPQRFLEEGDELQLGELKIKVMLCPGHSPGCICLVCEDLLLSGDVLFQLSMGRTDLPNGDEQAIMHSLKRLASLPGNYLVASGHGPLSTLDFERQYNPYIRMSGYKLGE